MKYLVSRHLVFSFPLPWALISIPGRPGCHGKVCSCTVFPWQPLPLGTLSRSASKSVWVNLRWSQGSNNILNNIAILSRGDSHCRCVWCVRLWLLGQYSTAQCQRGLFSNCTVQEHCFQKAALRDNLTSKEVKTKSWCWDCLHFSHVPACVWIWACSSFLEWPWAVTTFLCT